MENGQEAKFYVVFNESSPPLLLNAIYLFDSGDRPEVACYEVSFPVAIGEINHIVIYQKVSGTAEELDSQQEQPQTWEAELKIGQYTRTVIEPVVVHNSAIAIAFEPTGREKLKERKAESHTKLKFKVLKSPALPAAPDVSSPVLISSDSSSAEITPRRPAKRKRSALEDDEDLNSIDSNGTVPVSCLERLSPSTPPSKRKGHVMIAVSNTTALLLGGETTTPDDKVDIVNCDDSLYSLRIAQGHDVEWRQVLEVKNNKEKRVGHRAVYDKQNKVVSLVGGYRYYPTSKRKTNIKKGYTDEGEWITLGSTATLTVHNDVSFNDQIQWNMTLAKGKVPKMAYHSAVLKGRSIVTFGGSTPTGKNVPDDNVESFHVYNVDDRKWELMPVQGESIPKRDSHSAVLIRGKMYLFGGEISTENSKTLFNDLYILDIDNRTVRPGNPEGQKPQKRCYHVACELPDGRMFIHGGRGRDDIVLEDAHCLKISDESVTWCSVSHEKLTKLAGHSVVMLGDNVVIFGGMTDNETLTNNTIVFNYKELVEVHRYD